MCFVSFTHAHMYWYIYTCSMLLWYYSECWTWKHLIIFASLLIPCMIIEVYFICWYTALNASYTHSNFIAFWVCPLFPYFSQLPLANALYWPLVTYRIMIKCGILFMLKSPCIHHSFIYSLLNVCRLWWDPPDGFWARWTNAFSCCWVRAW